MVLTQLRIRLAKYYQQKMLHANYPQSADFHIFCMFVLLCKFFQTFIFLCIDYNL